VIALGEIDERDLVVRHQLARVGLTKAFFNLRDETQPLDGILDRGLFWQGLKGFDGALFLHDFHVQDLIIVSQRVRGSSSAQRCRFSRGGSESHRPTSAASAWCSRC
jgi:hypothetical protein